jgi:hypothetical protein
LTEENEWEVLMVLYGIYLELQAAFTVVLVSAYTMQLLEESSILKLILNLDLVFGLAELCTV